MMAINLLQWWYLKGWRLYLRGLLARLRDTADFVSIKLLLKTLFYPFRQISAAHVSGSLEVRFRALLDRLFSRVLGAIVRIFLIIFGLILLTFELVCGTAFAIIWPLFPFLPVFFIVLACMGVAI